MRERQSSTKREDGRIGAAERSASLPNSVPGSEVNFRDIESWQTITNSTHLYLIIRQLKSCWRLSISLRIAHTRPQVMPRPTPVDAYPTETSNLQADTEDILQGQVPLDGVSGRVLNKRTHLEFLVRNLVQGFPARYTSQDASQPWLMFWTLQSLSALQVGIDPDNKQRYLCFFSCDRRAE
jgi:hypothetical protein